MALQFNMSDPRCRACLSNNSNMISLQDTVLIDGMSVIFSEILFNCTSIQLPHDDRMPQSICLTCSVNAQIAYKFKHDCERSDIVLQNEFKDINLITIKTEDEDLGLIVKMESENEQEEEHEDEDILSSTPPDIAETADTTVFNLLPLKSKSIYDKTYNLFKLWCNQNKVMEISENILLGYLEEKSKTVKASTLWSTYSMLKTTLNNNDNLDISKFLRLTPYLKQKSVGYCSEKSKIFTREDINKFISEAIDEYYLLMKIVLIFGISGGCRRAELVKMTINDIQDVYSVLIVKVPDTQTHRERTFTITNLEYITLFRRYLALRPMDVCTTRFFLKYHKGKCNRQVVGLNKIGEIPSLIATYLDLPHPKLYTAHTFRRSSASILKRHGGWESSNVAESCEEEPAGM